MEYNTNRIKMKIPEYGRHIHKMVEKLTQIEDKEKRDQEASKIIKVMSYLNPNFKDIPDFRHKLWDQLFIMSNFIDINAPFPKPDPKQFSYPPSKITYEKPLSEFRHYGKIIQNLIKIALNCKDEQKKEGLFYVIANTMKKNYLKWNAQKVEDEVIIDDLKTISKGQIDLKNGDPLIFVENTSNFKKKRKNNPPYKGQKFNTNYNEKNNN
jgi:hypothetical protein